MQTKVSLLIEEALDTASRANLEIRIETSMLAGWMLTAISSPARHEARGMELLITTLREIQKASWQNTLLPGLKERYLINTAYLLSLCLTELRPSQDDDELNKTAPSQEELIPLICSLDPGSIFAEEAFLAHRHQM